MIDVEADINGSFSDPVLRIFDADGNQIAVDDDGDFWLDSLINFNANTDGIYDFGVSIFSNFDYDPTVENSGF